MKPVKPAMAPWMALCARSVQYTLSDALLGMARIMYVGSEKSALHSDPIIFLNSNLFPKFRKHIPGYLPIYLRFITFFFVLVKWSWAIPKADEVWSREMKKTIFSNFEKNNNNELSLFYQFATSNFIREEWSRAQPIQLTKSREISMRIHQNPMRSR